jgi:putative transposase
VAVQHRKVREKRADAQNTLAHRLARDNQAVHVETLGIRGLARTRMAKSIHDAAWGRFLGKVKSKAGQYGRLYDPLPRRFPSSQLCSACGHRDGPKPLKVREWTCPACGVTHDRDLNAARNILLEGQRQVAAGRKGVAGMPRQAETENACGAGVSRGGIPAFGVEAGTHRGAA